MEEAIGNILDGVDGESEEMDDYEDDDEYNQIVQISEASCCTKPDIYIRIFSGAFRNGFPIERYEITEWKDLYYFLVKFYLIFLEKPYLLIK